MSFKRYAGSGSTFSRAVEAPVGRTLYISGQVPRDANGKVIGVGDLETQSRAVFDKIKGLVEEAGGTMANVVMINTFLTSLDNYSVFSRIRGEYFGDNLPASATVKVAALLNPDFLIEVEAVAVLPEK
jgi:2-iminobutanoate/2-iminopropanoate deaminase